MSQVWTPACDYSFARPNLDDLYKRGYRVIFRYISRDMAKCITRAEMQSLTRRGFQVALVFEDAAGRALQGAAAGRADAAYSMAVCDHLGISKPYRVHFAEDYDPNVYPIGRTDDYAAQFAAVFGKANTGPYGGFRAVDHFRRAGYGLGWQTFAWSYGAWSLLATSRQVANGLIGGEIDADVTLEPAPVHTRPEIGGLVAHEWAQLEQFVHSHYARTYWQGEWTKLTSHPVNAERLWTRLFGAHPKG